MKSGAIDKTVEAAPLAAGAAAPGALLDFAELIKLRLTMLVLVTTAVGFYLGADAVSALGFFHVMFGTALAAAGAAALNQWWEHHPDSLMHRTRSRPIPAGRMSPRDGLLLGSALGLVGVLYLALTCNALTALLAAATIVIYLFGYTPLKRISVSNTLVGAIPGAIPPMIGWAAARNDLSWPAWSLFAILFCWQMPHFFAIAWLFRDDYARAGFRMLSLRDLNGVRSGRQSLFFALLLVAASTTPALLGLTSATWLPLVLLLGVGFLALAARFYFQRGTPEARRLFIGSIVYLPLLLVTLVLTKL
jgi:heme o synthase